MHKPFGQNAKDNIYAGIKIQIRNLSNIKIQIIKNPRQVIRPDGDFFHVMIASLSPLCRTYRRQPVSILCKKCGSL